MPDLNAVITAGDLLTPYGRGVEACWRGLLSGRTALAPVTRLDPAAFGSRLAALVPGLDPARPESLVMQMLGPLLAAARKLIPPDTLVILATTVGEVDLLEKAVLHNAGPAAAANPQRLLEKIQAACGTTTPGLVMSAACASSTGALAHAAGLIRSGAHSSVCVVACDSVTEFVFSGFSSLQALDPEGARPFDRHRCGLSLGEAAGFALVMEAGRAAAEKRPALGEIAGWGQSGDANHMTGPSRDGSGLARAIRQALARAGAAPAAIASISAHGTATPYNDAMEFKAFQTVFGDAMPPVYSVKGGIGHTLGSAGLIEALLALQSLREQAIPPTVNLREPDADAAGHVFPAAHPCAGALALSTNSGFGGVNAALVLRAASPTWGDGPFSSRTSAESAGAEGVVVVPTRCPPANSALSLKEKVAMRHPLSGGFGGGEKPSPDSGGGAIAPLILGIGWVDTTACGGGKGDAAPLTGGVQALSGAHPLFTKAPAKWGRFDAVTKATCCACALALRDAGLDGAPEGTGIIAGGSAGADAANLAYFQDYAVSGRTLGRGNLFMYTLPSSAAAEASIHFGLRGPLLFTGFSGQVVEPLLDLAGGMLARGEAPALLAVAADAAGRALAFLLAPGTRQHTQPTAGKSVADFATECRNHPPLADLIRRLDAREGLTP